jgi:hypothetical protein
LVVQDFVSDEIVSCTWMNAMGKYKTQAFALCDLEHLDRADNPDGRRSAPIGLGISVILAAVLQVLGLGAGWKTPPGL